MKFNRNKTLFIGTLLFIVGSGLFNHFHSSLILNASEPFDSNDIRLFDQNTHLNNELFPGGEFNEAFNGRLFPQSGNSRTGYYRGITSLAQGESDIYSFYDAEYDNTYVRMANFNGEENSDKTRISFYYFDPITDTPRNFPSTDYIHVAFSYRLYANDLDELNLNDDSVILRFQSRGSAGGKSGDVFLRDLVINAEGDKTWHRHSFTIKCASNMSTEYGWFYFFYNDTPSSMNPKYYIDIDNMFASLGEENNLCGQGTFDRLTTKNDKLGDSPFKNDIYPELFYKKSFGVSAVQDGVYNHFALRMKSKENKSTFSMRFNDLAGNDYFRFSFIYRNLSYYNNPNLLIKINGQELKVFNVDFDSDSPLTDNNTYSYSFLKENGWKEVVAYMNIPVIDSLEIDFILDADCDLAIDNLHFASVVNTNRDKGDYSKFISNLEQLMAKLNGYEEKYVSSSVKAIRKALKGRDSINEYTSQDKMDQFIEKLTNAFETAIEKGDYDKLKSLIDEIFDKIAGTNLNDYTTVSYLRFRNALEFAYSLNEDSSKEDIDKAISQLQQAYEQLQRREQ